MMRILLFFLVVGLTPTTQASVRCADLFPESVLGLGVRPETVKTWREMGEPISGSLEGYEDFLSFLRTRPQRFFLQLALMSMIPNPAAFEEIVVDSVERGFYLSLVDPSQTEAMKLRIAQLRQLRQLQPERSSEWKALGHPQVTGLLARWIINLPPPKPFGRWDLKIQASRMLLSNALDQLGEKPSLPDLFMQSDTYAADILGQVIANLTSPGALAADANLRDHLLDFKYRLSQLSVPEREKVMGLTSNIFEQLDHKQEILSLVTRLNMAYTFPLLKETDDKALISTLNKRLMEKDGIYDSDIRTYLLALIASSLLQGPVPRAEAMAEHIKESFQHMLLSFERRFWEGVRATER